MQPPQRIASLVPSATEQLYRLGLGDRVVAVTHECDYPADAATKPRVTRSVITQGLPPAEIDAAVREHVSSGQALYELDAERLAALKPDLIVAQELCAVCAVSYDEVCELAASLPGDPETIRLDPTTLTEVLNDLDRLGEVCGVSDTAATERRQLEDRLAATAAAVKGASAPRVVALEWHDPPFVGGHWVPEMVTLAGGIDVLGIPGGRSETATWEQIAAAEPEVAISMPCGYGVDQARDEAARYGAQIAQTGITVAWAVDAVSSFSRPGPRLIDGVELLAALLHPDLVTPPGELAAAQVTLAGPPA